MAFRGCGGAAPSPADAVFDVGCDETSVDGPCTTESTFALETEVLQYIQGELGKTPSGWEEVGVCRIFQAGGVLLRFFFFS
jgi:hypothetical protein